MSQATHDSFSMRLWGEAMEALLPLGGPDSIEARKRVGGALSFAFVRLVGALAPEICLEIGAHEASFSTTVKRRHPDMRVVAFEASPPVHEKHAAAVTARGVEYLGKCLSNRRGMQTFTVPIVDGRTVHTMGSVLTGARGSSSVEYEVETIPLDDFLGEDVDKPNALWLDVEGAAGVVLEGAERALRACRAVYVEVERSARWENQAIDMDIIAKLATYGLRPVIRDCQRRWQYNVVFLRDGDLAHPMMARICNGYVRQSFDAARLIDPAPAGETAVLQA